MSKNGLPDQSSGADMSNIRGNLYKPEIWNHLGNRIVHTSLPLRFLDSPPDPDGHCQFVGPASMVDKLINVPGFPKPVPKLKGNRPITTIRKTETMGLGVFATRVILPGELVHAERPLLLCPTNPSQFINKDYIDDYVESFICKQLVDQHMKEAVGRMDEERRKAYMSLVDGYNVDYKNADPMTDPMISNPLVRIALTNGFSIEADDGTDSFPGFGLVCDFGSRINHSCRPNVLQEFDRASLSFTFRALRRIEAHEQIFVTYINILLPLKDRQEKLTRYKIACTCTSCTKATPQSEKMRTERRYGEPVFDLIREARRASMGGTLDMRHFERLAKCRQVFIDEGLQATYVYPIILENLAGMCQALGLQTMAKQIEDEHLDRTRPFT